MMVICAQGGESLQFSVGDTVVLTHNRGCECSSLR